MIIPARLPIRRIATTRLIDKRYCSRHSPLLIQLAWKAWPLTPVFPSSLLRPDTSGGLRVGQRQRQRRRQRHSAVTKKESPLRPKGDCSTYSSGVVFNFQPCAGRGPAHADARHERWAIAVARFWGHCTHNPASEISWTTTEVLYFTDVGGAHVFTFYSNYCCTAALHEHR